MARIAGSGGGRRIGAPNLGPPLPWQNTGYRRVTPGSGRKQAPNRPKPQMVRGGADIPGTAPLAFNDAHHIAAMQQFLRNRGYSISVDGIRGPETNAAVAAFHNHVTAQQFNVRHHGHPAPVTPPHPGGGGGGTPPPAPPRRRPAVGGGGGGAPAPAGAGSGNYTGIPNLNPYAYARGAAGAEYDPQIAAAKLALDTAGKQGTSDLAQILGWYKQLGGTAAAGTAGNAKTFNEAASGLDAADKNTLDLFGGAGANPAAGEAAAFNDIGRTELTALGSDQTAFDRNLQTLLKAQGVEAGVREKNTTRTQITDLASQLAALRGAKGKAYTSDLFSGIQAATQQAAALQSLDLARQMAPAQINQANAQATAARATARYAGVNAANEAKAARLNNQRLAQQINQAKAGNDWNLTSDRTQRGEFEKALRASIQTQGGTFRIEPGASWRNVMNMLQQEGLSNDPNAVRIARGIFNETVNNSHAKRMWGQYNFVNGHVVKSGKRFAKRGK